MARMKRFTHRYGRITLATLGGFMTSIGLFMIVVSAATVASDARAEDECMTFTIPHSHTHWYCKPVPNDPTKERCCPNAPPDCPGEECDTEAPLSEEGKCREEGGTGDRSDECAAGVDWCHDDGFSEECIDCECNSEVTFDEEHGEVTECWCGNPPEV